MISVLLSGSEGPSFSQRRLKLDRILCQTAAPTEATDAGSVSDVAARSQATTRIGSVKSVDARVDGQPRRIPILRWLRSEDGGPAAAEEGRPARSWIQYDPDENDLEEPKFTFAGLQQGLRMSALALPALSGRWLLEDDDRTYRGRQAYTLVAYPLAAEGADAPAPSAGTRCLVAAAVSNDAYADMRFARLGVGRGTVAADGAAALTLCLFSAGDRAPTRTLQVLTGAGGALATSSGAVLRRDPEAPVLAAKAPAAGPAAADAGLCREIERLLEEFVPAELPLEVAVEAGDAGRVLRLIAADPGLRARPIPVRTRHLRGDAPPVVAAAAFGCAALAAALLEGEACGVAGDPCVLAAVGAADRLLAALAPAAADADGGPFQRGCPAGHPVLGGMRFEGASLLELALAMGHAALAARLAAAGHPHSAATALQMGDAAWLEANPAAWAPRVNAPFPSAVPPPRGHGGRAGAPPPGSNRWARVGTYTMLIAAARRRDAATVGVLLRHGADVFARRAGYRSTAINFAQASAGGDGALCAPRPPFPFPPLSSDVDIRLPRSLALRRAGGQVGGGGEPLDGAWPRRR